jgi:hypothetical protein
MIQAKRVSTGKDQHQLPAQGTQIVLCFGCARAGPADWWQFPLRSPGFCLPLLERLEELDLDHFDSLRIRGGYLANDMQTEVPEGGTPSRIKWQSLHN